MRTNSVRAVVLGCSLFMLTANAYACGESLFRVGKGVSFREYTAPLPGNILVVATTESELAFVERLAAAGHAVRVVSDPSEISAAIESRTFDIVLAYYSQRAEVESQIASTSTTYIPVARSGTEEVSQASNSYRRSLKNDDSVKTYLKAIHRSLKENA